jgi:hypothetical protein
MRYRTYAATALLLAVSLGAAACGGDDDDSASNTTDTTGGSNEQSSSDSGTGHNEADYVAALSDSAGEGLGLSDEEAGCFAGVLVDVVGVDGLEQVGAFDKIQDNPEGNLADYGIELDDQQSADLFDGLNGCTDLRGMLETEIASDGSVPPEGAACLVDNLDDDTFAQLMTAALTEGESALNADPDLEAALEQSAADCIAAGVDVGG